MTFEHLEYFIAVVEEPTFLDAAESLHITQSSLSKHMMKLEKELGITLLDRSRRSASLTDAGEEFYKEALALHRQYLRMVERMQKHKPAFEREIRIGTLPILMHYRLDLRIKAYSDAHADLRIMLDEAEETELLQRLEDNTYQFIITREHLVTGNRYQYRTLAEDELVAVLPASHPLALNHARTAQPVSLQELAGENFILMRPYTSIYKQCMEEFQKQDIQIHVIRTARVESILSAVSVGEGISLMPKGNLHVFFHDQVTAIPLTPSISLPVVLARKKDAVTTAAMSALMKCL